MRIEPLRIDEYDQLIRLWERCRLPYDRASRDSRRRIEQQLFDDRILILTLKTDEGEMIGSVIGTYDGRKGWINRLAVDPDYRGRRLAARLIEKAEEMLAEMGAVIIGALIEGENFPSMSAFRRCGFDGSDEFVYFRKLLKSRPDPDSSSPQDQQGV